MVMRENGASATLTPGSVPAALGDYALNPAEVGVVTTIYPIGDIRRYGAVLDGAADDWTAITNWMASCVAVAVPGFCPAGIAKHTRTVAVPSNFTAYGVLGSDGPLSEFRHADPVAGRYGVTLSAVTTVDLNYFLFGGSSGVTVFCSDSSVLHFGVCDFTGGTQTGAVTDYRGGLQFSRCTGVVLDQPRGYGNDGMVGMGDPGGTFDIQFNGLVAGRSSDIQINSPRCSSAAMFNIIAFDVYNYTVVDPECSGAKTRGDNNSGYGHAVYKTSAGTVAITATTPDSGTTIVTTAAAHGMIVGDYAFVEGVDQVEANGIHEVLAVIDADHYRMDVATLAGGTGGTSCVGWVQNVTITRPNMHDLEGTAVYCNLAVNVTVDSPVCVDVASVQDDNDLPVGGVAFNDCILSRVIRPRVNRSGKTGIVFSSGATYPSRALKCSIDSPLLESITTKAIWLRGSLSHVDIVNPRIFGADEGIVSNATPGAPLDHIQLLGGGLIQDIANGRGVMLIDPSFCKIDAGLILTRIGQHGIQLAGTGEGNVVVTPQAFGVGLAGPDNTWGGVIVDTDRSILLGATHQITSANDDLNIYPAVGVQCASVKGVGVGNSSYGAWVNVGTMPNTLGGLAMANLDMDSGEGGGIGPITRMVGSPSQVVELIFGDAGGATPSIGTRYSTADYVLARNAYQPTHGADEWQQDNAGVDSMLLRFETNADLEIFHAPAGTANGDFATFWGTAVASFSKTGRGSFSGGISVDGNQVVGPRGAAIADPDGSLASATSRITAILAQLRLTGQIAP